MPAIAQASVGMTWLLSPMTCLLENYKQKGRTRVSALNSKL